MIKPQILNIVQSTPKRFILDSYIKRETLSTSPVTKRNKNRKLFKNTGNEIDLSSRKSKMFTLKKSSRHTISNKINFHSF